MGASFDLAVTKWKQEKVEFIEFHEIDTFSFDQVSHGEYRSIQDNEILYQGCYIDLPLKNERSNFYISYYLEQAQRIKNEILKHEKWQLYKWLSALIKEHGEKDLYFSDDIGGLKVFKGYEVITKTIWTHDKTCGFNEDGKLLLRALDVMGWKYGLELPHTQVYYENLNMYAVGENEEFDKLIAFDTTQYVLPLEAFLKSVQKQDDDEFFEERFHRWEILVDCFKQGAKFVCSV